MLIKHLPKSKVKNPNKQPTRLNGGRRNNSPWSLWPSRAAWDQSPCLLKHQGISSHLPQASAASSGAREVHAGQGMFAAAAAAGALPPGAPWAQRGRTAWPRQGSSSSIEAALNLVLVTDWQPRGLERWSGGKDAESGAARPCSHPAHTWPGLTQLLLAAGEASASLCCFPASCSEPAGEPDTQQMFSLSWVKLALKNPRLFAQRKFGVFVAFFLRSCTFMFISTTRRQETSQRRLGSHDPGAEVCREKEICHKTQVTGQARNLEVLKHTLHTVPRLAGCQTFSLPRLKWKLNKQGRKHKLRTYSKAHCSPEKGSHGLNGRSGLSQTGLIVKICNCNTSKYKNSLFFSWRYIILPSISLTIQTILI